MNRLLTRGLLTRSLIQPVRPGLRQLASPVHNVQRITIVRRSSEEAAEPEGGSIQKVSIQDELEGDSS